MNGTVKKSLAFAALAAICACSAPNGGTSSSALPSTPSTHRVSERGHGLLSTIVGVGDSLTAGYQAGGFLGATGYKNPLEPGTQVPPTQENGWWADLYEMASNLPEATAIDRMYDPSTSPLPLIKGPGLNNQLVPASGIPPLGELKSGNTCTDNHGFNAAGYVLGGLATVRVNPSSTLIRDVAVPGTTAHEAVTISQPQNNTCEPIPGIPGLLAAVVDGEASTFWPVLGNFAHMGTNLTQVRAAASLHPTLATVWLGANDVLKYMGSGGRFVGGDNSAAQAKADLLAAIQTLKYAGAKTVVLNLPDLLRTPYFFNMEIPKKSACHDSPAHTPTQTYAICVLVEQGLFDFKDAKPFVEQLAAQYHLTTPNGCTPGTTTRPCGYITLQGALGGLAYYLSHSNTFPNLDCSGPGFTKPCVAGSGLGAYYITPAFAAKIQLLNNNVNAGIDAAATYTQSAFVDVRTIFNGILSGNTANPYFAKAISINPGTCCTLANSQGLVSFDGLHPSNTGYALIAYYVIQAINQRYGQHIREINVTKAYNGTRCSNKLECYPDVYAPH
jgi:lysophospholipase L1-like esterase